MQPDVVQIKNLQEEWICLLVKLDSVHCQQLAKDTLSLAFRGPWLKEEETTADQIDFCNVVWPNAQHLFFHSFKAKRNIKRKLPQEKRDYTGTAIRKRKGNNESSISFKVTSKSEGAIRRNQVPWCPSLSHRSLRRSRSCPRGASTSNTCTARSTRRGPEPRWWRSRTEVRRLLRERARPSKQKSQLLSSCPAP